MNINTSKNNGFSLIEVLIAVLVLGIGILAVSKLQTSLIRSGSDANHRSVAANIAQRKIDDLRRFSYITTSESTNTADLWNGSITSPLSLAYNLISTDEGGLLTSPVTIGKQAYSFSWTVADYYYSGSETIATTTPSGADHSDFKTVHLAVTWDGVGDDTNNIVSFDSIIHSYAFSSSALDQSYSTGGSPPVVTYKALNAPDVIPISLEVDNLKKETSKPVPEVSKKANSTEVSFETVTYNTGNDTIRREEFRTVSCKCKNQAGSNTITRGLTTWDSIESEYIDYIVTLDGTGKTKIADLDNEASVACPICCNNGREGAGVTSADLSATGNLQVCRMKRVNGVLRVFRPWKMVAFNIIPASYFNDNPRGLLGMTSVTQTNNIATYSKYVTGTIRDLLFNYTTSAELYALSTIDTSFSSTANSFININPVVSHTNVTYSTTRPFQVRAVYMDYPPNGIYEGEGEGTNYTATNVPLDRIPFYEVNMTELAGWYPDDDNPTQTGTYYTNDHDNSDDCSLSSSANCVTNEELVDTGYSRGEFNANLNLPTTISSVIFTSNDGIVNQQVTETTSISNILGVTVTTP